MAKSSVNTIQKRVMTQKRLITIIALTTAVLAFALFSNYGLLTRMTLMSETETLQMQFDVLRNTSDSLRRHIRILETDRNEIERLARERYGYVRPDEEVFIINRDSTKP
jgi:cell division protein FtsB